MPALTGFNYSAVTGGLKFTGNPGKYFWSNGYAYGTAEISGNGTGGSLKLKVLNGSINISGIKLDGYDQLKLKQRTLKKNINESGGRNLVFVFDSSFSVGEVSDSAASIDCTITVPVGGITFADTQNIRRNFIDYDYFPVTIF